MDDAFREALKTSDPVKLKSRSQLVVAIEGYSFASRSGQAFSLGEVGGIIRTKVIEKFPTFVFLEVQPTQLKKFVTGSGRGEKDIILKEVFKNFGFDTNDNNVADAYGLAFIADTWYNVTMHTPPALKPHQLEVIEKLGAEK